MVVRDVDEGDTGALLDGAQFGAHVLAQFEVEGRKRLVEQHNLGFNRKGAGDGHALLLAAGKLADALVGAVMQIDKLQQFFRLGAALFFRSTTDFKAEGDVFPNRHQGEQSQILDDEGGGPIIRADAAHVHATDFHGTFGRVHEAGDEAQDGGLAAARWAEKGKEFASLDGDIHLVHGPEITEIHADLGKLYVFAHACPAPATPRSFSRLQC